MASLRDLGLSEYEARAYRALLRTGATTAKELSRASDVPMGRVYDVLNSLEQYNLIRSQAASRPKKYVAVEPDTALDRLLEDKRRELEEKVRQYEELVDELADELDAAEPVEEQFWTAAIGMEETTDLLLERLAAADRRIVMVSNAPSSQFDIDELGARVAEHLEAAVDRGVSVSVLMTPELAATVPREGDDEYNEYLAESSDFEIRVSDNIDVAFNLIDDAEACIEVPNPLNSREPFAMIDLKDREFAADLREMFESCWERADVLDP